MRAEARHGTVDLVGEVAGVRASLPRVTYRVSGRPVAFAPPRLDGPPDGPWTAEDDHLRLTLSARPAVGPGVDGLVLRLAVTVVGPTSVRLDDATLLATGGPAGLRLGAGPGDWSLYRNGWSSWSNARAFRMDEGDPDPWFFAVSKTTLDPDTPRSGEPGRFRSELVAGLADRGGSGGLVLGFIGGARCLSVIDLAVDVPGGRLAADDPSAGRLAELAATCRFDGITVEPGTTTATEDLLVADGPDPITLLEGWAAALGAAQSARVPARPPHGWCSWYYHYAKVTEADVQRALRSADAVAGDVPLGYVMIDDGHQAAIGDWLATNAKFGSGMASLAADIRATGRDAGIWLAPFLVDHGSDVARAHPDWLLRDEAGAPVTALWNPQWNPLHGQWVLDCTKPEVIAHLTEVARTLSADWGYRVLKLDFCYAAALPGRRHDPTLTRAEALRVGLDAIRHGAGEDAVLIGCGLPLGPAVGVVDAMRIGTDVAPTWGGKVTRWATSDQGGLSTRVAMRNTLTRAFLHGHLWSNDPDCVMVRTDRTRLTDAEVRFLVAAVALTDGMIVSSDQLDRVPPERLDLLRLCHELAGGRCRVVDLFAGPEPETVTSTKADEVLWGRFHWGDAPVRATVELDGPEWERLGLERPTEVVEAFTGARLAVRGTRVDLGVLEPHDARVLRLPRR
ncbi:glycoside hydrolase family 36 protein [Iamia sp.]|uniref:glycoside hydrolase family 36 protein n=1 Tax=Iamia sp. TaxID=2722710 RepID=UPI002BA26D31|nr:glycoside hydrolase family 36 protein [Iamia sp.]HXH56886.1 glycoside hydrolase family 36 protein [Iamia sp.]